ncbi:hypothetical protein [Clavibacter capsici]|uniref:hypothetical protein n=1 Tax=Clavibacter capsici TaxID=1874630 RepID=UPI000AD18C89|nr:hypothetical protein [Clavibacter capsici]
MFDPLTAEQTSQLETIARDILANMSPSSLGAGRGSAGGDDLAIPSAPEPARVGADESAA